MQNEKINNFIDAFDEKIEERSQLTEEEKENFGKYFSTTEDLTEGLPAIKEKAASYKESIENCAKNIKMWQDSKKMWESRFDTFMNILGKMVKKLQVPGNAVKADGVKLAVSSRSSLEVDEDWLLAQFQRFADALQTQLPNYVVVKLSVDKNKLNAFLKTDDSMLLNNPDKIHTKVSTSTSIKWPADKKSEPAQVQ